MEALVIGDTAPRRPRVGKRPAGAEPRPRPACPARPRRRHSQGQREALFFEGVHCRGASVTGQGPRPRRSLLPCLPPGPAQLWPAPPQPHQGPSGGRARAPPGDRARPGLRLPAGPCARRPLAGTPRYSLLGPAVRHSPASRHHGYPRGSSSQSQSQVCKMVALCVSTLAVPGMQMKQWEPRASISSLVI